MPNLASKNFRRPRIPSVIRPRQLALAFAGVAAALGLVGTLHHFAAPATKVKIEAGTLAVIDLVRENRGTPEEVVFWLDLAADAMPMMRGEGVTVTPAETGNDPKRPDAPVFEPRSARPLTRLHNIGYEVGYDESRKTPAWVTYRALPAAHKIGPRPSNFDTDTRTRAAIPTSAYNHSGYDRGHMAPNYAIGVGYGERAQHETFLMSNITPQLHGLNDGLWREMEQRIISRYPRRFKEVRVTCGPVFDHPDRPQTLRHGVWIPDAFYLIVSERDPSTGELHAQAYLVPHREITESADPSDYLTDIRTIEARTGLDFFPTLPAAKQNALETSRAVRAW